MLLFHSPHYFSRVLQAPLHAVEALFEYDRIIASSAYPQVPNKVAQGWWSGFQPCIPS